MSASAGSSAARRPGDPTRLPSLLRAAAFGRFPSPDGAVEVVPRPDGPADAVVAFTAHHVVAAGVDPAWVAATLPTDDLGGPMRAGFLVELGRRLGHEAGMLDLVLAAIASPAPPVDGEPGGLWPVGDRRPGGPRTAADLTEDDMDHPRLARARRYRDDVRCFRDGCGGLLTVGRGLAGRTEVSIEVDPPARGAGLGVALARAALRLGAAGEPVFAQVSPGNVASLRCFLAAGYRPVGAEVLFHRGNA